MSAVSPQTECALRPMQGADLRGVVRIERESYRFPWSEGIFRDCLRVGYCCWVVEAERRLRGYGIMQVGGQEAHILNLCVAPKVQRSGHGQRLLAKLLQVACQHRADTALLEVRPSNRAAIRLYQGMGFNQVGVRRAYYPGTRGREDALILARDLSRDAHPVHGPSLVL